MRRIGVSVKGLEGQRLWKLEAILNKARSQVVFIDDTSRYPEEAKISQ